MNRSDSSSQPAPQHRLLVVSMPKAGTYLLAEILKGLGCEATGMHLFDWAYTDYSGVELDEARYNPNSLHRETPLEESITLIHPGSFAVSHLACQESVTRLLNGFKQIFLYRELRVCLVSWLRFMLKTRRGNVEEADWFSADDPREQMTGFLETFGHFAMQNRYLPMLGWLKYPGTLSVRFEDLVEGGQQAARQVELIAWYLGIDHAECSRIIEQSLSAETLTKNSRRTRVEDYWSDRAEEWFNRNGGDTANWLLGYAAAPPAPSAMYLRNSVAGSQTELRRAEI